MLKLKWIVSLAVAGTMFAVTSTSRAQPIYTNNFNTDDSANWVLNFSYVGASNYCNFNFDYTTLGIPVAPHSAEFGSAAVHHGLKLCQNWAGQGQLGTVAGMSASPTNFSITSGQNFVMHADMWINVNCTAYPTLQTNNVSGASYADNNHDGSASTVLCGVGFGTAGTEAITPGLEDCTFVGALTDNGSSAQMRMYAPKQTSSYQNGYYQYSGTGTPGYPGDQYVYNIGNTAYGLGSRAMVATTGNPPYTTAQLSTNLATGRPWASYFPSQVVPLQQQILYPQQTNNASLPGLVTFGWHDVSLEQVGNVLIYKIDGNIIATANYNSAGAPSGNYLVYMTSRTSYSSSTDPNYTNLNFVVFANLVVSNYNNVVNISAPQPSCQEGIPSQPGVFTLTRSSAGVPLTVNYTLSGTATNGSQYTISGGTLTNVTFASTALSTNISIIPIDDGVPEPTHTVILTLQSGTNYVGAGNALVDILDGDTPTVDITSSSQAYGRYTNTAGGYNDYINYTLTRRGLLTIGSDLTVNLAYSGSAVPNTDFTPVSSVTIPDGMQTATLQVVPVDDPSVTTNRTVVVSVTSGANYVIGNGPATGTVVSAHYAAPVAVLLSDDLTSSGDANNWNITYGCGDPFDDATDYEADFGMNLSSAAGGITVPPPPGGNANALHLTCNKDVTLGSGGAVNAYYTNLWLSGNYAVRFNMNMIQGKTTAANTEGAVFGINHSGSLSNWWYGGGFLTNWTWASDGVWFYVTAQPGATLTGDYTMFTGAGGTNGNTGWQQLGTQFASSFSEVFKDTSGSAGGGPFTCLNGVGGFSSGSPAEGDPTMGYDASTWSDVEIKQQNGVVTMSINHTPIFVYTNTTVWTNGYLMLGYADPFGASIGNPEQGVYYANLQVVQLPTPPVVTIKGIKITGGNVVITFTTSSASDTVSSFTLQSSGVVAGPYNNLSPAASLTSLGGNQFKAITPYNGGVEFYRIQHN